MKPRPIRKAVFPIAGRGSRFLPATRVIPKEMLPVVDKPLIQWAVEEACAAGIEELIFVLAADKTSIMAHFDPDRAYPPDSTAAPLLPEGVILHETMQEKPLGLGHAICCSAPFIKDEPFAVLLPDDMILAKPGCLAQMLAAYATTGGNLIAIENIAREQTNRYGIITPGAVLENNRIVEINALVEKPDPTEAASTFAITGRYILDPRILPQLAKQQKGKGGEIQLTDALAALIESVPSYGFHFNGKRYDCGSRAGWLAANMAYGLAEAELAAELGKHLSALLDPDKTDNA